MQKNTRSKHFVTKWVPRISSIALVFTTFACTKAKYEIIQPYAEKNSQNFTNSRLVQDTFQANQYNPIEILFAVDSSSSLTDKRQKLQDNLRGFIQKFTGVGFQSVRISVMGDSTQPQTDTVNCPRTNNFVFPDDLNIVHVYKCIGSYNAISRLSEYYHSSPAPQLTANANLEAIIITDDNGKGAGNLASDFSPKFDTTREVRVSAITAIPNVTIPAAGCTIANFGAEPIKLANTTGGKTYDICNNDWSTLINSVATDIVGNNSGYNLTYPVDPNQVITVQAGSQIVPSTAYSLDVTRGLLVFNSSYPLANGAIITVSYYTKTP